MDSSDTLDTSIAVTRRNVSTNHYASPDVCLTVTFCGISSVVGGMRSSECHFSLGEFDNSNELVKIMFQVPISYNLTANRLVLACP